MVKYSVLDKLLEHLDHHMVVPDSSKVAIAVLSNAALCCGHCFLDGKWNNGGSGRRVRATFWRVIEL